MTAVSSGTELGRVIVEPPGPRSRRLAAQLQQYESRNVTFIGKDAPVFIASGRGANLVDVDGNVFVDLTGAFGVAAVGHSNPKVVGALAEQGRTLLHGMGDFHPTEVKVELEQALCELVPGSGPKRAILASSGAEAVEAAMKTAVIATGKPRVLRFSGGYHGLTYGALALTDGDHFRAPFAAQLGSVAVQAPYPYCYRCPIGLSFPSCNIACFELIERVLDGPEGRDVGAVIVEPVQGRGGDVPAPLEWLRLLRDACDRRNLLLIADEIYTGFGRTGRWFACERAGIAPDIICVGKGMSSGFPISACVGRAEVMDRWPKSLGEAIHTSTFLGHPAGCAAALASIAEIRDLKLVERTADLEPRVAQRLSDIRTESRGRIGDVRGCGLMWGLECVDAAGLPAPELALAAVVRALKRGVIMLEGGTHGNVLSLSPPLVITEEQLDFAFDALRDAILGA